MSNLKRSGHRKGNQTGGHPGKTCYCTEQLKAELRPRRYDNDPRPSHLYGPSCLGAQVVGAVTAEGLDPGSLEAVGGPDANLLGQ